jgi:hypothetical protein
MDSKQTSTPATRFRTGIMIHKNTPKPFLFFVFRTLLGEFGISVEIQFLKFLLGFFLFRFPVRLASA